MVPNQQDEDQTTLQRFAPLQAAWTCRCLEGGAAQRTVDDLKLLGNVLGLSNRRSSLLLPSEIKEMRGFIYLVEFELRNGVYVFKVQLTSNFIEPRDLLVLGYTTTRL